MQESDIATLRLSLEKEIDIAFKLHNDPLYSKLEEDFDDVMDEAVRLNWMYPKVLTIGALLYRVVGALPNRTNVGRTFRIIGERVPFAVVRTLIRSGDQSNDTLDKVVGEYLAGRKETCFDLKERVFTAEQGELIARVIDLITPTTFDSYEDDPRLWKAQSRYWRFYSDKVRRRR